MACPSCAQRAAARRAAAQAPQRVAAPLVDPDDAPMARRADGSFIDEHAPFYLGKGSRASGNLGVWQWTSSLTATQAMGWGPEYSTIDRGDLLFVQVTDGATPALERVARKVDQ